MALVSAGFESRAQPGDVLEWQRQQQPQQRKIALPSSCRICSLEPERFSYFASLSFVFFFFFFRFAVLIFFFHFVFFTRAVCFVLFVVSWLDPLFHFFFGSLVIFFHHRLNASVFFLRVCERIRCGYAFWRIFRVLSSCGTAVEKNGIILHGDDDDDDMMEETAHRMGKTESEKSDKNKKKKRNGKNPLTRAKKFISSSSSSSGGS